MGRFIYARDSRIVDEHGHLAKLRFHRPHDLRHLIFIGNIQVPISGGSARLANLIDNSFACIVLNVRHRNRSALAGQGRDFGAGERRALGYGLADPVGCQDRAEHAEG